MDLRQAWETHRGRPLVKLSHFPEAQHRHLARYQGRPVTLLEIGVAFGGSLQLWRSYLGPDARIIGVDVDPRCTRSAEDGFEILIGDQGDRSFLEHVAEVAGSIDVVIDDGGHLMEQQITTFDVLFPRVATDGVYLCEDTHTSYRSKFGGGHGRPGTFIEFAKAKIDEMNAWFSEEDSLETTDFTRSAASMHFYPGMVVVEKAAVEPPRMMGAKDEGVAYFPLAY